MPKGVYDRGKGKAVVVTGVDVGAKPYEVASVRRCDRCEAFDPDEGRAGSGLCVLNPEPVPKHGHMRCLQFKPKS